MMNLLVVWSYGITKQAAGVFWGGQGVFYMVLLIIGWEDKAK